MKNLGTGFVHHVTVTDLHYDTNHKHSANICNLLIDVGVFDKLMILGDVTDDNTLAEYDSFVADGWANNNGRIIFCLGNHDVRTPSGGYPTSADYYRDFLSNADYSEDSLCYVYTDYCNHIKYVILNTETITASPSDPQYAMIREAVAELGWTVFVLAHRNMNVLPSEYTWSGSLGDNVTQAITEAMLSGKASIGGFVCGHQHVDIITPVANKFYHFTLANDRNESTNYYNGYSITNRRGGTIAEQAITILSVNTAKKEVKAYRIGASYSKGVWGYKYATKGANLPETEQEHTITLRLVDTEVITSSAFVKHGESYTASILPSDGFSFGAIKIMMGNADITAEAFTDGIVNIESVTDDVIIDCVSLSDTENLVVYEKADGGVSSFDYENNHVDITAITKFFVNGVNKGEVYDVEYIGDVAITTKGCGVYAHPNAFTLVDAGYGANLVRNLSWVKRGIEIPDNCKALVMYVYTSGKLKVTKRLRVSHDELFTPENVEIVTRGDATYTINDDGSITVNGTIPSTTAGIDNSVSLLVGGLIANKTYNIVITSDSVGYCDYIQTEDIDVADNDNGTIIGGFPKSASNFSRKKIDFSGQFLNNVLTGKGKLSFRLRPATTYHISIKMA